MLFPTDSVPSTPILALLLQPWPIHNGRQDSFVLGSLSNETFSPSAVTHGGALGEPALPPLAYIITVSDKG